MSSEPPQNVTTKGKRSKTKTERGTEVGSSARKLLVKRARVAIGRTPLLDPSIAVAGEVGFARRFASAADRDCFFFKCFNRRKVIVERAITILDFSFGEFASLPKILRVKVGFASPNPNLLFILTFFMNFTLIFADIVPYLPSVTTYVRGKCIYLTPQSLSKILKIPMYLIVNTPILLILLLLERTMVSCLVQPLSHLLSYLFL